MPPPAPTLPEELLEEIFLRLPPDEPACLVRASLASKLWLALLTGPAFRGRYTDFHGDAPMLGFLLSWLPKLHQEKRPSPHFVSTTKFGARIPNWRRGQYDTLDCRHGRVLLADTAEGPTELDVWDPMTGYWWVLEPPDRFFCLGAAVLCAVTRCDHRPCHRGGPFRVFLSGHIMNTADQRSAHLWVCSEFEDWSQPCSPLPLGSQHAFIEARPSLLLGDALYLTILYRDHISILKYDMGANGMSLLDGPPSAMVLGSGSPILVTMEDASLGFTYLDGLTLYRWTRQIRFDGVATSIQRRVVDLNELLPIQNPEKKFRLIGFKEGSGIVFVTTDLGIYEINLKSLEWKKLWKREKIRALIPYMTFYNPPERVTPV